MLKIEDCYDPLYFADVSDKPSGKQKRMFTDDMLPLLSELVSKSAKGIEKIVEEFRGKYGDKISKHAIANKVKEIAVREKREGDTKAIWHLREENSTSQVQPPQ